MRNKGTWILFLVVVLLSAYAYLGEYKGKEKEKVVKEEQSKIFKDLKPEQINYILIEGDKEKISLSRTSEGWKMAEPVQDMGDSEGVESWLKQLVEEKTISTAVEGKDIQWQFFGFDKKAAKLTLSTTAGASASVEVSDKKNFENNSFLRIPGQSKVFVASSSWSGHIGKKSFDLRNKKIFRHQISNVQSVVIKNKKDKFSFVNKEAKWLSPEKSNWILDQNKVRESISKLNETMAQAILVESSEVPSQKSKYNLTKPEIQIEVNLLDKKWTASLVKDKDNSFIMLINDPFLIVKVDNSFGKKFESVQLNEYRDTKLPFLALDKTKVKNIDFETSLKKSSFVENNGKWELTKEDSKIEVQQETVKGMMDKIKDLNVLNYINDAEFKKTKLSHKIQFLDQDKKTVFELTMSDSIKKKVADLDKNVRIARTNLFNEPFIIEDLEIDKLQLNEMTKMKEKVLEKTPEKIQDKLPGTSSETLPKK
ncbi:MAG: DUF4340 domain-containing protein [Deltaproteobacteria bacterium]|nr:DUF4340 domain-containing protein [Deltaproteobacteria bacterium]